MQRRQPPTPTKAQPAKPTNTAAAAALSTHSLGMGENHSVYDDMICHGEPINYHWK